MRIPMKISADGTEQFWFSGDDDVWVYLNGQLVLDLGGLHSDTQGSFHIDANGNVVSTVDNVADPACRVQNVKDPRTTDYNTYNSQVENACPRAPKTYTYSLGLKTGDVVNLDFFYAERSTTESNTHITITNMNWYRSLLIATSKPKLLAKLKAATATSFNSTPASPTVTPKNPLDLERLAAYISEKPRKVRKRAISPLDSSNLEYTLTPEDPDSWQPLDASLLLPIPNKASISSLQSA